MFVQFAADNNDLNEDTLDGKHTTHATTMVAYQRKAFGPELPPQSLVDHSLKRSPETPLSTQTIHDFGVRGRRPTVTSFLGKVQHFGPSFDNNLGIERKDFAWFLLRLNKHNSLLSASDAENGHKPFLVGVHLTPLFYLLLHNAQMWAIAL